MPTTFSSCNSDDDDVDDQVASVIERFHPELHKVELTVYCRFARNSEEAPLKRDGFPVSALLKVNSYSDRQQGHKDVTVTLDADAWAELKESDQVALLDELLSGIEPRKDQEGGYASDDCGRPKLRKVPVDWRAEGRVAVVKRHHEHAPGYRALCKVRERWVQADLQFPDEVLT